MKHLSNLNRNETDTGKINADGSWNFYLKDHLGSIRVATNESHDILSAQDYDMWGQILDNRSYEIGEDRYKFTGKERDFISQFALAKRGYDYFGARYYDARVGRWGSVEPRIDKYPGVSPYCYVFNNPLKFSDTTGLGPRIEIDGNNVNITVDFYYVPDTMDSVYGLNEGQVDTLNEFAGDIRNSWTGTFEMEGQNFNVTTTVNIYTPEAGTSMDFDQWNTEAGNQPYYNMVANAEGTGLDAEKVASEHRGVAVQGNMLWMLRGSNLKPYADTGSHEMWHLLGGVGHPTTLRTNQLIPSIAEPANVKNGKVERSKPSGKVLHHILKSEVDEKNPFRNGIYNLNF